MATGNPIILGGGIGKGSPFTLGSLLRVSNVTPPTAADSEVFQRTQAATEVITVGTPWTKSNTLTEKLQVVGGLISDSGATHQNFVGGELANVALSATLRNVCIGFQAQCNNSGGGGATVNTSLNVVIGPNTFTTNGLTQGVGSCVFVGGDIVQGNSFPGGSLVAIGYGVDVNVAPTGPIVGAAAIGRGQGVAFGNFAGAQGNFNNWVCVGHSANINAANAMALGDGSQSSFTTAIALGRNATTLQNNQLVIGGANLEISNVLIGEGDTAAAPIGVTHRYTNASGNNAQGGNVTFVASLGTGNVTTQGQFIFQTGAAGAGGAAQQVATSRLSIIVPTTAAGAAVNFLGTANGAGAAVGTLNNAPAAGNPTYWLPVLVAGAIKLIPCW